MILHLKYSEPALTQVTGEPENNHFHCLPHDGAVYNLTIPGGRKKESITYSIDHADEVDILATMGLKSPHIYYQHKPSNTTPHRKLSPNLNNRNLDILRANTYKSESSPNPKPPPDNKQILITTKSESHKHFRVNFGGER
jgi:hypothetical protein